MASSDTKFQRLAFAGALLAVALIIGLLLTIATTRSKVSRLFDAMLRLAKDRRPPLTYARMPEAPRRSA